MELAKAVQAFIFNWERHSKKIDEDQDQDSSLS